MNITLAEAKNYLKVDTTDDDSLIEKLLKSSERIVKDVARIETIDESKEDKSRLAILHTLEYLYDTRGNTAFNDLLLELRSLLDGVREYKF